MSDFQELLEAFAWRACAAGRVAVPIDEACRPALEQAIRDGTLLTSEQGLLFADELTMVDAATQHVLRTECMQLLSNPKACFDRLDEIAGNEIGKKATVSGHVLAALHNAGRLDAYAWGREAIEAGVRVFDVLHVMEGAVVRFEHARTEAIYEFFAGHYEQVKNDLAGGLLYAKLPAWLAKHPDVARELKQLHEATPQERSASIYGCALHGLVVRDFANGFALTLAAAHAPDSMVAGPALHILGLVEYSNLAHPEAVGQVVQKCAQILRTAGHPCLGTAVGTLGRLVTLDEKGIVDLLFEAGKSEVPEVLYGLSELLWREQKALENRDWFWPLLLVLAATKPEHGGILRNIDMILMGWVQDTARESQVIEFLNAWIAKQPRQLLVKAGAETYFSSMFHRLKKQPILLSKALTGWLLADDDCSPLIAKHAVSRLRAEAVTSLAMDPALVDELAPNEVCFLLRRILGYIIGDEVQIGLVFSLVYTKNAKERTFEWVTAALCDQVGYDYPYQTIEFLKKRQDAQDESADVKALCSNIAAKLQAQLDALNVLADLKEFQAASSKVRQFAKKRHKQMNKAFDEANKDSIWRQIASNVTLKAGRRTFQSIDGRYTEPMELKGMSHSMALPRSEISDPAGASRERLQYRAAKRDTP